MDDGFVIASIARRRPAQNPPKVRRAPTLATGRKFLKWWTGVPAERMLESEAAMSDLVKSEADVDLPTIENAEPDEQAQAFLTGASGWAGVGRRQRWELPAADGVVALGRAATNEVSIAGDPQVSRVHARLERVGGQWTLLDDGLSANGTFVNGRRVSGRVRLADRDVIRVGATLLAFCTPGQAASEQTVAGAGLPGVGRLTEPQLRVLGALCRPYREGRGYPVPAGNQQVADELCLSLDAVKTHLRVLFHKFGIEKLPQNRKRARLAELALGLGLVPDR
jgi:hypothetical protein